MDVLIVERRRFPCFCCSYLFGLKWKDERTLKKFNPLGSYHLKRPVLDGVMSVGYGCNQVFLFPHKSWLYVVS